MKLLIPSPYCFDKTGHYYTYYSSLVRICSHIQAEASFLVAFTNNHLDLINLKRWFQNSKSRVLRTMLHFLGYYRMFKTVSDETYILLESYALSDLVVFYFALLLKRKKSKLLFFIRDSMTAYPIKQRIFFFLIKRLCAHLSEQISLVTDSEVIQRVCSPSLPFFIHLLPIPHTTLCKRKKNVFGKLTVWFPGAHDSSRGYNEVITFANSIKNINQPCTIYLSDKFSKKIPPDNCFSFLPSFIDNERYAELLSESTFIFLLYDPLIYCSRTSGIFVEAIFSRTFVVVLEGSWMAYELERYNLSELVISKSEINKSLIKKLDEIKNSEDVQNKFGIMCNEYCTFHNETTYASILKSLICQ